MRNLAIFRMCAAALLIAVGILIPMFSPVKIILEPASFTLASHVAIFIAMFISPWAAVTVALGTTLGFFLGGFPLIIVLRAASHVVFASLGAWYLKKHPELIHQPAQSQIFSFSIGVVHTVCEVAVVTLFYFGGNMSTAYYQQGFFQSVILLLGLGGLLHSMLDFAIALVVVKVLSTQPGFVFLSQGNPGAAMAKSPLS